MSDSMTSRRSWRGQTKESTSRPIRLFQALVLLTIVALLVWVIIKLVLGKGYATTHWFTVVSENYQGLEFPPVEFYENDSDAFEFLKKSKQVSASRKDPENWTELINALKSEMNDESVDANRDVAILYLAAESFVDKDDNAYLVDPNLGSLDRITGSLVPAKELLETISKLHCETKVVLLDAGQIRFDHYRGIAQNTFTYELGQIVKNLNDPSLWVICSHDTYSEQSYASYSKRKTIFNLAVTDAINHSAKNHEEHKVLLDEFYRRVLNYCGTYARVRDENQSLEQHQLPVLFRGGHGFVTANQFDELTDEVIVFDNFPQFVEEDSKDDDKRSAAANPYFQRLVAGSGTAFAVLANGAGNSSAAISTGPFRNPNMIIRQDTQDEEPDGEQSTQEEEAPPSAQALIDGLFADESIEWGDENKDHWKSMLQAWLLRDEIQERTNPQSPVDYAPNLWHRLNLNLSHLDRKVRGGSHGVRDPELQDLLDKLELLKRGDTSSSSSTSVNPDVQDHLLKSFRAGALRYKLFENLQRISSEPERELLAQNIMDFQDTVFRCQYYVDWVDDVSEFYPNHKNKVMDLLGQVAAATKEINDNIDFQANAIVSRMGKVREAETEAFEQIVNTWDEIRNGANTTQFRKEQVLSAILKNPLIGVLPRSGTTGKSADLTRIALTRDWLSMLQAADRKFVVEKDQQWPIEPQSQIRQHEVRDSLLALGSLDPNTVSSESLLATVKDKNTRGQKKWLAATVLDPRCWEQNPIDRVEVTYTIFNTIKPGIAKFVNSAELKMWNLNSDQKIAIQLDSGDLFDGSAILTYDDNLLKVYENGELIESGKATRAFQVARSQQHSLSLSLATEAMMDEVQKAHLHIALVAAKDNEQTDDASFLVQLPVKDRLHMKIGPKNYPTDHSIIPETAFNDTVGAGGFLRAWTLPNSDTDFTFGLQNLSGRPKEIGAELFAVALEQPNAFMPGRITSNRPNFIADPDSKLLEQIENDINSNNSERVKKLAESPAQTLASGTNQWVNLQWGPPGAGDEAADDAADEAPPAAPSLKIVNCLVCRVNQKSPESKSYYYFVEVYPINGANLITMEPPPRYDRDSDRFIISARIKDGVQLKEIPIQIDHSEFIPEDRAELPLAVTSDRVGTLIQAVPPIEEGQSSTIPVGINILNAPRQLRFIIDRNQNGPAAITTTNLPMAFVAKVSEVKPPSSEDDDSESPPDESYFKRPDALKIELKTDYDPSFAGAGSDLVQFAFKNSNGSQRHSDQWACDRDIEYVASLYDKDPAVIRVQCSVNDHELTLDNLPLDDHCEIQVSVKARTPTSHSRTIVFDTSIPDIPPSLKLVQSQSVPKKELVVEDFNARDYRNGSGIEKIRVSKRLQTQSLEDVEPYVRDYHGVATDLDLVFDKVGNYVVQFQSVDRLGNESRWSEEYLIQIRPETEVETDPKPKTFKVVFNVQLNSRAFPEDPTAHYDLYITGPTSFTVEGGEEPRVIADGPERLPEGEYTITASGKDKQNRDIVLASSDKLIIKESAAKAGTITTTINLQRKPR